MHLHLLHWDMRCHWRDLSAFSMNAVIAFDTLAYANKLKSVNIPPEQAEMQAEAMRDVLTSAFQTAELATKPDIALVKQEMATNFAQIRQEMATKSDLAQVRQEMATKSDLVLIRQEMAAMEQRLDAKIDAMMNKIIIRLTVVLVVVIGTTQTLVALLPRLMQ